MSVAAYSSLKDSNETEFGGLLFGYLHDLKPSAESVNRRNLIKAFARDKSNLLIEGHIKEIEPMRARLGEFLGKNSKTKKMDPKINLLSIT